MRVCSSKAMDRIFMIELIFTLDYEIYGNGAGSLRELVYEPTEQLAAVFKEWNCTFVVFAEAAEFEKIEDFQADELIRDVRAQIRELHRNGFEIALHIHPQWCNARRDDGAWQLDSSEYNLCTLPSQRIDEITRGCIAYLREMVGASAWTPLSFRAGNWLFQPTKTVADILSKQGIQIDSSVFKGGLQRNYKMDYRPSLKNGYYWKIADDANEQNPGGRMLEIPIYTEMMPCWKMLGAKRFVLQSKNSAAENGAARFKRLLDFARFLYPRKLDFCRMNYKEMRAVIDKIVREDKDNGEVYKPIVAIGHSKDLVDLNGIRLLLSYLNDKGIAVSKFEGVLHRLQHGHASI
jgi:hypothetical protein